jgi:hypothetical protein
MAQTSMAEYESSCHMRKLPDTTKSLYDRCSKQNLENAGPRYIRRYKPI